MRVPDWLCDAAIETSRLLGVADCRNRGPLAGAGDMRLIQVLEAQDEQKMYRFECSPTCDVIEVWDSRGASVPFSACDLGGVRVSAAKGCSSPSMKLVSISIPASVGAFWVKGSAGMVRVGRLEARAREIKRNCLMVNPGIDSLYPQWAKRKAAVSPEFARLGSNPLISIVTPLYNTPVPYFNAMLDSVLAQTYGNWELVLVNASPENADLCNALNAVKDERVLVVSMDENKGISENTVCGIEASSGDYISFLDHDDVIEPSLLYEYAKAIADDPDIDLLYCDEDSLSHDGSQRFNPSLKFDLNLDLLLTHNYVCHMLAVSRRAYDRVVPYDSSVDGAQDFDLTLKVSRVAKKIVRIPKVLYHWRQHAGSTNGGSTAVKPYVIEASVRALSGYLRADGIDADIVPTEIPCVFEERYPAASACDVSIAVVYETPMQLVEFLNGLSGQKLGIVEEAVAVGPPIDLNRDVLGPLGLDGCDADGGQALVEAFLGEMAGVPVRLVPMGPEEGFGVAANTAVKACKAEHILLARGEVRFDEGDEAVSALRSSLCRNDLGIVSAKAMAADGLVYHAGLCVKDDGRIGYLNQGFVEGMGGGYHGCAECACDYSAVDAACIMFRAADHADVGGFSGEYQSALAESVDFSFRVRNAGKKVAVMPQAKVSVKPTCGAWELGESYLPADGFDYGALWSNWGEEYRNDVLSHPDIDLSSSYFRLKV